MAKDRSPEPGGAGRTPDEILADIHSHLLDTVFGGFIQREPDVLRAIEAFGGDLYVQNDALIFTIPALFEFIRVSYESSTGSHVSSDRTSYVRFRKSLYGKRTNSLLKARGGRVQVVSPHADHDLSVYRLVCGGNLR